MLKLYGVFSVLAAFVFSGASFGAATLSCGVFKASIAKPTAEEPQPKAVEVELDQKSFRRTVEVRNGKAALQVDKRQVAGEKVHSGITYKVDYDSGVISASLFTLLNENHMSAAQSDGSSLAVSYQTQPFLLEALLEEELELSEEQAKEPGKGLDGLGIKLRCKVTQ